MQTPEQAGTAKPVDITEAADVVQELEQQGSSEWAGKFRELLEQLEPADVHTTEVTCLGIGNSRVFRLTITLSTGYQLPTVHLPLKLYRSARKSIAFNTVGVVLKSDRGLSAAIYLAMYRKVVGSIYPTVSRKDLTAG